MKSGGARLVDCSTSVGGQHRVFPATLTAPRQTWLTKSLAQFPHID